MSNSSNSSGGIGFCGVLTVAFIVMKLTGYIDWSWVWVLAPFWIPVIVFIIGALIALTIAYKKDNRKLSKVSKNK